MEDKKQEKLPYSPTFYDRQKPERLIEMIQACAKALQRKERLKKKVVVHVDTFSDKPLR